MQNKPNVLASSLLLDVASELEVGVISTLSSLFSFVALMDAAGGSNIRPFVITVTQSAAAIVRRVGDFCFPCLELPATC